MEIIIWNILKPLLMKTCYKILINTKEETNLKDIILSKFCELTQKWYSYKVIDLGILKKPVYNSERWNYQPFYRKHENIGI